MYSTVQVCFTYSAYPYGEDLSDIGVYLKQYLLLNTLYLPYVLQYVG